jgi:hypothetical protein
MMFLTDNHVRKPSLFGLNRIYSRKGEISVKSVENYKLSYKSRDNPS